MWSLSLDWVVLLMNPACVHRGLGWGWWECISGSISSYDSSFPTLPFTSKRDTWSNPHSCTLSGEQDSQRQGQLLGPTFSKFTQVAWPISGLWLHRKCLATQGTSTIAILTFSSGSRRNLAYHTHILQCVYHTIHMWTFLTCAIHATHMYAMHSIHETYTWSVQCTCYMWCIYTTRIICVYTMPQKATHATHMMYIYYTHQMYICTPLFVQQFIWHAYFASGSLSETESGSFNCSDCDGHDCNNTTWIMVSLHAHIQIHALT